MATKSKRASSEGSGEANGSSGNASNGGNGGTRRPVHEIRLGKIRAAIWANQIESNRGGATIRHNVTFTRLYLDGDNHWRDSSSFGRDDMPLVMKVADLAHTWIYQHSSSNGTSDGSEESQGRTDDEF